jgi:predicted metal-dependent HD superfamily phosphohydrolase
MFGVIADRLARLRARYAEPHRAYHDQTHVDALLALLAEVRGGLHDAAAIELAIWYHDAIYDPARTDNETRSAVLLRTDLASLADPLLLARAETLVLATATHTLPTDADPELASDCATFLDMDLSILGAPEPAFRRYDAAIRREYAAVPDADYRAGRSRVLRGLLARPRLYLTGHFQARFDAPARCNLAAALAALSSDAKP